MCGFVGVVGADGPASLHGVDCDVLERARLRVDHRGPDSSGTTWRPADGVALAFARLRILDLSAAADQPMWTDDGRVGVVFNGEIYNFRDLRRDLEATGRRFRSSGDTEVVLEGYLAWGDGLLDRLVGMWAFAVIDLRSGRPRVLLSRDRMGEKPLFWHWDGSRRRLTFASELPAVTDVVQRTQALTVDPTSLRSYLTLGYVPAPRSMIAGVQKVEAGAVVTLEAGAGEPVGRRWWSPPSPSERDTPSLGEVRALVSTAVERRRVSDVPIGVLLSGGIDSTIVTGLLAREGPVQTFSAAFDVGPRSFKYNVDADVADEVARTLGTDHHRLEIELTAGLWGELGRAVAALGEPHANPTALTTTLLARQVRAAGVTVVLTGDGSDELFGGYDRYRFERWVRWASQSHLPVAVLGRVPERFGGARNLARRAGIDSSSPERYLSWWRVFEEAELDRMLTASDAGGCAEPAAAVALLRATIGDVRAEDAVAAADLRWWIPDECNARVDHAMMSAAVEARAVFEDHHLVEALAARRMSAKVGRVRWRRKAILVDAFRELLPEVVRRRPKWGWFSPVHYWVNDVLWDDLAEVVRWLPETGLFSPDVRRMVDERPTSDPHAVWALGVFGLWYRWLLEGSPPDPST